jgi:hypothetical protein
LVNWWWHVNFADQVHSLNQDGDDCRRVAYFVLEFLLQTYFTFMNTPSIPFQITDWDKIPAMEYPGELGTAFWQTLKFGSLRVRLVNYSANFLSDHWCKRGHIMFVVSGVLELELADGQIFRLTQGMSFEVSDQESTHRTRTGADVGATLFVVDGGFLTGESTSL